MDRKLIRRICAVAASILLGAVMLLAVTGIEDRLSEATEESEINVEKQEDSLLAWKNKTTNESYPIHLWQHEGKEYLFLPGKSFTQKQSDLELSACTELRMNGENFVKGNKIEPDQDTILLETMGMKHTVSVVRLSELPLLAVTMDEDDYREVNGSKENEAIFELSIYNKEGILEKTVRGDIHARGNSSFRDAEKKSYTLSLNERTECCGMQESDKWLLISNYFDPTALRNYLTFQLAEDMKLMGTPEAEFVNLYINGEFKGIYLFCSKIEIDENRVKITDLEEENKKLNHQEMMKQSPFSIGEQVEGSVQQKGFRLDHEPDDITGGYLLELELYKRLAEEKSAFVSEKGQPVVITSPKYASVRQVEYISGFYQEFEDALKRSNQEQSDEFAEYIDLESFARKYLIEELSKNLDASVSSQYLYKDSGAVDNRLYAGPVWDYDKAYGNFGMLENYDMNDPEGMFVADGNYGTGFWKDLCDNIVFREKSHKIYQEEMMPLIREYRESRIDEWAEKINKSVIADHIRWKPGDGQTTKEQESIFWQAVGHLKNFMGQRSEYLWEEWNN